VTAFAAARQCCLRWQRQRRACETEVQQLRCGRQHDVARLRIAVVTRPETVSFVEGIRDMGAELQTLDPGGRHFPGASPASRRARLPSRDSRFCVPDADVMERANGGCFSWIGFASRSNRASEQVHVGEKLRGKNLMATVRLQPGIPRAIHLSHAAGT